MTTNYDTELWVILGELSFHIKKHWPDDHNPTCDQSRKKRMEALRMIETADEIRKKLKHETTARLSG